MQKKRDSLGIVAYSYHLMIALIPVLYIYNTPVLNMSLGTVLIILFLPYALWRIFKYYQHPRSRELNIVSLVPLIMMFGYYTCRSLSSVNGTILMLAVFIHLWGIMRGSLDDRVIRRIMERFALLCLAVVLVQLFTNYILHYRFKAVFLDLLQSQYKEIYYSFVSSSSLYRPAAFFCEPSHFAEYSILPLISALFPQNNKPEPKIVLAITADIILSGSGIGIILLAGVFVWFALVNEEKISRRIASIIKWSFIFLIAILLLYRIPFIQKVIQRAFYTYEGYDAVSGRTGYWASAIEPMDGLDYLFGYGGSEVFPHFLSGVPETIYQFGIIGLLLQVMFLVSLLIGKASKYTWVSVFVFIGLMLSEHLSKTHLYLFYFGFICSNVVCLEDNVWFRIKIKIGNLISH